MTTALTQPIKWHGGKHYLAKKIIALMPSHIHYVEPYFGGGSVLLAKDPDGVSEVVNDINSDLITFWNVLADPVMFTEFNRMVDTLPFSEVIFNECISKRKAKWKGAAVSIAAQFFVACRQSMSGRMKDFSPTSRTRTRRGMNEQVSSWLTAIEGLPEVHARLKRVLIQNRPALDCIASEDGPQTLFYLDPPYLHETRTAKDVYEHEMTSEQHCDLLDALRNIEGKFLLSGYRSMTYDTHASVCGWNRHDFEIDNKAGKGPTKRKMDECVWCNF